ncbi:hypothetical protein [Frondihabitans cladoniiphilus]|uniref:Hpr(Ser) kinase/phosphatase n=1 Tax=Frondihabitans cladoniiphilus TaxID=715785 RepID=A0ABP8VY29_9MICO
MSHRSTIGLEFFGVRLKVSCAPTDVLDIRYLYSEFVADVLEADLLVDLTCVDWPSRGFFSSLLAKDGLAKRLVIKPTRAGSGMAGDSTFSDWSDIPSPFPPLFHSNLWLRFATTPGAVVRLASGALLLLVGANYVGKTSTAIALCGLGAELVTDNLAIFDIETTNVQTYETPLGFRRDSLRDRIPLFDSREHRTTVSPDTGLVGLLAPIDVLGGHNAAGGPVDHVVVLRRGDGMGSSRRPSPDLPWFTGKNGFSQSQVLPKTSLIITTTNGTSPDATAKFILDHL